MLVTNKKFAIKLSTLIVLLLVCLRFNQAEMSNFKSRQQVKFEQVYTDYLNIKKDDKKARAEFLNNLQLKISFNLNNQASENVEYIYKPKIKQQVLSEADILKASDLLPEDDTKALRLLELIKESKILSISSTAINSKNINLELEVSGQKFTSKFTAKDLEKNSAAKLLLKLMQVYKS